METSVLEQVSRLYGYAILIAGIHAVLVSAISALPLTKWDDVGVPRADIVVFYVLFAAVSHCLAVNCEYDLRQLAKTNLLAVHSFSWKASVLQWHALSTWEPSTPTPTP